MTAAEHFVIFKSKVYMVSRSRIFTPNDQDMAILRIIYEHRYMSIELLAALLVRPPEAGRRYGFSLSALRARCQKLRAAKYLTWQFLHDQPIGRGHHTERPAVYSIGPAAIPLIAEQDGTEPTLLKSIVKRNTVGSYFLRHALGISKFRVCLTLACQRTIGYNNVGGEKPIRIGAWLQEGLNDAVLVGGKNGEETIPVVPDALFSLITGSPGGEQTVSHFALELDRGTMTLTDIARKARGYWHYLEQGLHRRKYTYAGETDGELRLRIVAAEWRKVKPENQQRIIKFGIRTLQVLFVTRAIQQDVEKVNAGKPPDRQREQNMIMAVRRAGDISQTTSRFLFCTEDLDYQLDRPESILEPIWHTLSKRVIKCPLLPAS